MIVVVPGNCDAGLVRSLLSSLPGVAKVLVVVRRGGLESCIHAVDEASRDLNFEVIRIDLDEAFETGVRSVADALTRVWRGERVVVAALSRFTDTITLMLLSLAFVHRDLRRRTSIAVVESGGSIRCIDIERVIKLVLPLGPEEMAILDTMLSMGGCARIKDLVNELSLPRATLYKLIARLMERGYIYRKSRGVYCIEV